MGFIWGLIAVLVAFMAIVTIFDIVRRGLGAGATAGWIVLVIVLPGVGSLIYWVLRRPTAAEIERTIDADAEDRRGTPRPRSTRFGA